MFQCALCLANAAGSKYNKYEHTESWVMLCEAHKDFKLSKIDVLLASDLHRAIICVFMESNEKKRLSKK